VTKPGPRPSDLRPDGKAPAHSRASDRWLSAAQQARLGDARDFCGACRRKPRARERGPAPASRRVSCNVRSWPEADRPIQSVETRKRTFSFGDWQGTPSRPPLLRRYKRRPRSDRPHRGSYPLRNPIRNRPPPRSPRHVDSGASSACLQRSSELAISTRCDALTS
jgi:hypothetical protein